ncbi:aminotransferase class V-fold PLP-dependent enzyme [Aestuariibacter halophilus]|uniref:cysteine desulfurase n=1 Tax=Fluctibacter halophilus TaxID=226011 RepID=A0ABS8G621_9ALTE|nr:aminotransferase class V-fold PLP-dependent enzyme [Aestuariibacter halophilus]MCC2615858.1 aminotransferase class V-fold PLP-dependent enzyme [Aestuariibacter halophilus]
MSDAFRSLFPAFEAIDCVYLDSAATTQKPQSVLDAMQSYYINTNANVHRGAYQRAQQATEQFEQARETVAGFIHAPSASNIVWCKGTTDGINLIANGLTDASWVTGSRILVSGSEHHANLIPWQQLAKRRGWQLDILPVDHNGIWQLEALDTLLSADTAVVAIGHVSNALGVINPLGEVLQRARLVNALTVVDGAQAVGHLDVDVQALDCDFYVFSAHKMYGPTGIGAVYGKTACLDALQPTQFGGEMVVEVTYQNATFQPAPLKFEAGTPAIAEVIGFAAAVGFMQQYRAQLQTHERLLLEALSEAFHGIDGVSMLAADGPRIPLVSLVFEQLDCQDVAILLDRQGIAVRTGHHCAMPLIAALGHTATLRVSLGCYNTLEDIQRFALALRSAVQQLRNDTLFPPPGPMPTSNAEETLAPLASAVKAAKGWDNVYRQVMLAGKSLPRLSPQQCTEDNGVKGCESAVWICVDRQDPQHVQLAAESPSKIVRGLLALIIEALQGQSVSYIRQFNVQDYLDDMGLQHHLSESRGNGLRAVMARIIERLDVSV